MQKNVVSIIMLILVWPLAVFSQEAPTAPESHKNHFYVSPVDLFLNTLELGYERSCNGHNSLAIFGGLKLSKKDNYYDRTGGTGEVQYRINLHYKRNEFLPGTKNYSTYAYFAPYFSYRYEQITDVFGIEGGVPKQEITMINSGFAGVGFGFRLSALSSRFCMNVFAGGGLKYSDINGAAGYNDFLQPGYTGIAPKLSFQLGISF